MNVRTKLTLLLLSSLLAACSGGGGGGGGGGSASAAGEVQFVPVPSPIVMAPPADALDATRATIDVQAGRTLRVRGRTEGGRDALHFRSRERVAVSVRVAGASQARLAHLDPISLAVGPAGRAAQFLARGPFDLLVRGEAGDYELEVAVGALGGLERGAGHLGTFVVGDELELALPPGARAQLSCAESLDLVVRASAELAVFGADGAQLAHIGEQGGEARVAAAPLASFELLSRAPSGARVRLFAQAAEEARPCARVRGLDEERAAFALSAGEEPATAVTREFVPGEVLVHAREGADLALDVARRAGRVSQRIPQTSDLVAFELPAGLDEQEAARTTLAAVAAFEAAARVEWAEPNRIRRACGGVTLVPNDPFYPLQWHYPLLRLPEAWSLQTGSSSVVVAVIDTGSRPHPDLDANVVAGYDFVSSLANAGDGDGIDADPFDVGDGNGLTPSSFHGTHVAGTIGAVSNDGAGVAGVCWSVSLMPLRVLGKQGGTDADIAQAIRFAARLANASGTLPAARANVINMSLGGPGSSNTVQSAVTAARNAGVAIFAAAGNSNSSQAFYPAAYNGVISIAAVDRNALKAPYSNFGASVDLAAPGGDISVDLDGDGYADGVLSTLVEEANGAPMWVFYQGTSMACPHAAGVAALMLSENPTLTPAQVESMLVGSAIDLGAAGRDDLYGHGLIQADRAVLAAAGGGGASPVLSVAPGALVFGSTTTSLTLQVTNAGGGLLDVGVPNFTPLSPGGAPVFATLQTVAGGGASDVSAIVVDVDRNGLADGEYTGQVTVPSANGGTVVVPLSMEVATASAPLDVPLFLLLVDASTLDTVAQVDLNPTTGLAWSIDTDAFGAPLGAGDYFLVCGSDDDGDDQIFGPGDLYTGAWPSLNELAVLALSGGDAPSGLDFVVGPVQTSPLLPGGAPPRTFRLLSRER